MNFKFDSRPSDSPFVERIWRTQSQNAGMFISLAESHWEIVVTRQKGKTYLTVRGPETKASPAPFPEAAEFFGITFRHGAFMPYLPASSLVDGAVNLPWAASKSFWLNGSAWQFPDFENADTFVERLVRQDLLVHDEVVSGALQSQPQQISLRSIQRRFLQTTGLTFKAIQQIERARDALNLLQQGVPILETVHALGYFDQSHLTNSLRRLVGQTPAQILRYSAA